MKSLQTGLLLFTGLAGYVSACCPVHNFPTILGLTGSLFLAISGATVLNMVYDRDIDAKMDRTCLRPLPAGIVQPREALILGSAIGLTGIGWAWIIDDLYGLVIFAGFFVDLVVYTMLLKRRTAWAVVWGGIAGGMPVLAGRVLAVGAIDWVGIALMFTVIFWIPTHIMTINFRYQEDYVRAGISTFPQRYGVRLTQRVIALSAILATLAMCISAVGIGLTWGYLRLLIILSAGLFLFATCALIRPSSRMNFGLFKYASLYMLGSMLLFTIEGIYAIR
ncbi:MAG: protoheme IX farnesyltransferase [Anaerolineales bacterium]|nr:MAG: protoheme IX farnesyltransferase [Anaerolineales bacterium]